MALQFNMLTLFLQTHLLTGYRNNHTPTGLNNDLISWQNILWRNKKKKKNAHFYTFPNWPTLAFKGVSLTGIQQQQKLKFHYVAHFISTVNYVFFMYSDKLSSSVPQNSLLLFSSMFCYYIPVYIYFPNPVLNANPI